MPIVPTLALMAGIYQLSREGGPRSPRFTAYVKHAEHVLGLSGYNPMAGSAALETVNALIAMNAEDMAGQALLDVAARCDVHEPMQLALVVASAGMWTDRLATEVQHRTDAKRAPLCGTIQLWTREPIAEADVRREAAAEAIRTAWTMFHGMADTAGKVLAREGFAYAPSINAAAPPADVNDTSVPDALAILGDTANLGEIVALLYGDDSARQLGYSPLGLRDRAGFRWAAAHAMSQIHQLGAPKAIRAASNLVPA